MMNELLDVFVNHRCRDIPQMFTDNLGPRDERIEDVILRASGDKKTKVRGKVPFGNVSRQDIQELSTIIRISALVKRVDDDDKRADGMEACARFDDKTFDLFRGRWRCAKRPVVFYDPPERGLVLRIVVGEVACDGAEQILDRKSVV